MADSLVAVILSTLLTVTLSAVFGFLPAFFTTACATLNPHDPKHDKAGRKNMLMSFLLNFGGGVLIANCFCHWLPEVREGLGNRDIDSVLPMAEVIMCVGFFSICLLEEIIHHVLLPMCGHSDGHGSDSGSSSSNGNGSSGNNCNGSSSSSSMKINKVHPKEKGSDDKGHHGRRQHEPSSLGQCEAGDGDADSDIGAAINGLDLLDEAKRPGPSKKKWSKRSPKKRSPSSSSSSSSTAHNTMSVIRTFFVVSALSFHSVIEGLAMSLERDQSGVWMNFGALALHKFVIAFAVGVELVSAGVTRVQYIVSIMVFSLAPALGAVVGIILTMNSDVDSTNINDFVIQVLQGLATGTIIYVVFFEIFPKAKEIGGTGFQHVVAMILGFAVFLPSLFFHSHSHEEAELSLFGRAMENLTMTGNGHDDGHDGHDDGHGHGHDHDH